MRAVQIITSLAVEAAGPNYTVRRLAEALAERGIDSEIFSLGTPNEWRTGRATSRVFAADHARLPIARSVLPSRELSKALHEAGRQGAVLHAHGLWRMPNIYPSRVVALHKAPLVFSPRGMLAPVALKFSAFQKRVFWMLLQRSALAHVTCVHATSRSELEEVRALGLTQPVALIPNGIDVPVAAAVGETAPVLGGMRTVLHLGRLHAKKRIDRLIDAWACLEPYHPDWRLRIVGPAEGTYGDTLRRRAARLGLARVFFEEPIYGEAKNAAYRDADLFVLPTENENFGMVVAEALANGTPVIATKGAPWSGLSAHRCGWWIEHGVEPLAEALSEALALPRTALDEMGVRGRTWMLTDFSWERVAADMEEVYNWCSGRGERPDCVVVGL